MRKLIGLAMALYIVVLGLIALALDHQLHKSVQEVSVRFAETMGREIAISLGPDLLSTDRLHWPAVRRRLQERLTSLDDRSELVGSVSLIGPEGKVLASTEETPKQAVHTSPQAIFGASREPKARPLGRHAGGSGLVLLQVPVGTEGPPQAYLELTLRAASLAATYERGARYLMAITSAGLGLLVLFGIAMMRRLAKRDRGLRLAIDHALEGKPVAVEEGAGEFSLALQNIGRLGASLISQRRKSRVSEQVISHLPTLIDVGLIAIGSQGEIELMNATARGLLSGGAGLEPQLKRLLKLVAEPAERIMAGTLDSSRVDVELDAGAHQLQVRCEVLSVPCEDSKTLLLILRDLEALEALEADLRDAAQLRGLAVLYLGMAHDLKAPLNAMALHIELLQRSLSELAEETHASAEEQTQRLGWIGVLKQEVERLERGLDALVAQTALPRQGRSQIDVRSVLREIGALLSVQARQQKVNLEVEVGTEPLMVLVNPDHLKQAVLNLAINALEAQPDGGRLRLEARASDQEVILTVADAGKGIPAELRDRVFDLRYSGRKGGLGVGLYVARSIARGQGGSLEVAEVGAEGTTFRLTLPKQDPGPRQQLGDEPNER